MFTLVNNKRRLRALICYLIRSKSANKKRENKQNSVFCDILCWLKLVIFFDKKKKKKEKKKILTDTQIRKLSFFLILKYSKTCHR